MTDSRQSKSERVFREFMQQEWWGPLYERLCDDGGGQPMHSSLRFHQGKRSEWLERFTEAQAHDRSRS